MDAFSVSLANGLHEPAMSRKKMIGIAGVFTFFQALMPLLGWILVHTLLQHFKALSRWIPWIALLLLLFIGGKMIREGCRQKESSSAPRLGAAALLLQGIATSIDALSVGLTIGEYPFPMALVCALIIAAVTLVICLGGLLLGRRFGTRFSDRASFIGGLILIAIGIEIFLKGILS